MKLTLAELQEWGRLVVSYTDQAEAAILRGDGGVLRQALQLLREKGEAAATAIHPPRSDNTDATK